MKTVPVELVLVEHIPSEMRPDEIYYSEKYKGSAHLCLCGCGHECYLPIKDGEWTLTETDGKVTITPSILQRFDCKSHYIITNGRANFV